MTPEQWDCVIYTEGDSWSVRQVLAHFVSAEGGFALLIKDVLSGGQGSPLDFDLDAYNARRVRALDGLAQVELLQQYADLRKQFIDLVRQMSPEDLTKTGRHPFLGVAPIEDIVKLLYRHNQIHLRDVRRALG